jgi:hypothetical protein
MTVNLHIERVILEGLPADVARSIRSATETELARLVRESGLAREFHSSQSLPAVPAGTISISHRQPASRLGVQLAGAVYRGIGGRR